MDIGAWLRSLGLGQYETAFRDNAIDEKILPSLTGEDLKEIGVGPVGHRRSLLDAIAALGAESRAAQASPPAAPSPSAARSLTAALSSPRDEAERRPITVMFCDLVGSTSLAAKLDAEDWRDLVGAYLDEASQAVTGFGGHVLKKLGDGLMALFGYPRAQENDAERAARAALAILRSLEDLNARNVGKGLPALAARIGLESGPVVVDATGEVFGEAPNVAARAQSAAEPGTVLVTAAVQRQIAGLFVVEDKGPYDLKGVAGKPTLYRIVRASGGGRRIFARSVTAFVGREEELALLMRRFERARGGDGQFVQIVAEPGLGKSRLMEELRQRIAETPHTWVEWSASQLLQNTPLHPLADWGRQRFGAAETAGEKRLAELESTLAQVKLDPSEHAPLLAPLLDIPLPPERASKLAPDELRRRQLAAMVAWLLVGARAQTVVLAFEDLQWADPTTVDLLKTLAERGASAPLFILATARPEFRAPWATRSHHAMVSLVPLDRVQILKMVASIAERHAFSKEIVDGVSERTGGVPLFVEEVTRLLLERGDAGSGREIPPTLQQSLAARLDRLGDAREVAQIGAVLGREFSFALLKSVAAVPPVAAGADRGQPGVPHPELVEGDPGYSFLAAALEKLADADLMFVEGSGPEATYRFKHALIQDAAYDSLLKGRRQVLHRRAAEALVASPDPQPELVAHHFTQSNQTELAIEWWGKAGDAALRRSAFQEAISHLGKAIEMADKEGGATRPRDAAATASARQRLKLQTSYGQAVLWAKGFAAEETKAAFARVGDLANDMGNAEAPFDAYYARWIRSATRGEIGLARETAESFLREAVRQSRPTEEAAAHRCLGATLLAQGDFAQAAAHLGQTLRIYDPERDRQARLRFGQDSDVAATAYLAHAAWRLGDVERARELIDEADARAAASAYAPVLANTHLYKAIFEAVRDDAEAALRVAEKAVALSREHGLVQYLAVGVIASACARAKLGDRDSGSAELRQALTDYGSQGNKHYVPIYQGLLAEIEAEGGNAEAALAEIDEALALAGETGEHWFDAGLHRIRGEILLKQNPADPASAEAAFLAAIAVAQQQKARSFQLRAALSLAKLYQFGGRAIDAHDILGPALGGFAPTPELPQIAEAQGLLDALAETEEVKAASASRERRMRLQVSYGQAVMHAQGFAAEETKAAIARVGELATEAGNEEASLYAYYGQWVHNFWRGEFGSAREAAESFLSDAEREARLTEASVAHRLLGLALLFQGDFAEARGHFERALSICDPERDREAMFRFGQDPGVAATACLAFAAWPFGDVARARELIDEARARAVESNHAPTLAVAYNVQATLGILRDEAEATRRAAEALVTLSQAHGLQLWLALGTAQRAWAHAKLVDRDVRSIEFRQALADYARGGNRQFLPLFRGLLAEIEAERGSAEAALAEIDEALSLADETGEHWFDAALHRIRGEILIKQNTTDPAPAEAAFLAAIAVAQQQEARSFELRAALPLAKLYQSEGRAIDAHDVLGPALEGFSPTPELPAIAEAQALLAALEETDAVRAERRNRGIRAKYAQALLITQGHTSPATQAALDRVEEAGAPRIGDSEYWAVLYGRWSRDLFAGELRAALDVAERQLCEAEAANLPIYIVLALRLISITKSWLGSFVEARDLAERVLKMYDEGWAESLHAVTGMDFLCVAYALLAIPTSALGEAETAKHLLQRAARRAEDIAQPLSLAYVLAAEAQLMFMADRPEDALRVADALVDLTASHAIGAYDLPAKLFRGWAYGRLTDAKAGTREVRAAWTAARERGAHFHEPGALAVLAELEAAAGAMDEALVLVAQGLEIAARQELGNTLPRLHRLRGDIFFARDPAAAEASYRESIRIAREQGARTFVLLAALPFARLLQTNNRPAEAYDALASALEGFAPTPELPQIAEAQALLAALAARDLPRMQQK